MSKKKWLAMLLALLMCVGWFSESAMAASKKKAFTNSKAAFKVGSTSYKVGTTSTTWKRKLGKYSRSEVSGYSSSTKSYIYTFTKGIKIVTEVSGKKEKIVSVTITGKQVGTSGGLKVGNTITKMEKIYGAQYRKSGVTYTYSAGSTTLGVKVSGKKIKSIFITLDS